jgi:peptide/nickel transport system permease protein
VTLALRVARLLAVLVAVSALTFLIANLLPGDPASAILGEQATPEAVAQVRDQLGLDDPLPERYFNWLGDAVTGDFGASYRTNTPVLDMVKERLPVSLEIMLIAQLLAIGCAVPVAMVSAYRQGKPVDRVMAGTSFALLSAPNFIVAMGFIYLFAIRLGWFPATGFTRLTDDPIENLRSAIMPAIVLCLGPFAVYTRVLRNDLVDTLQQDFILMARSQGLPPRQVLWRHALRPSLVSVTTLIGISIGTMIGGSVIVEQVFALPGIGSLLVDSIRAREYTVLQGLVLMIAVGYVTINFLVDMLYLVLDPRIRHGHH